MLDVKRIQKVQWFFQKVVHLHIAIITPYSIQGLEYLLPFRVAEVVSGDESSDSSDMDMGADNALI